MWFESMDLMYELISLTQSTIIFVLQFEEAGQSVPLQRGSLANSHAKIVGSGACVSLSVSDVIRTFWVFALIDRIDAIYEHWNISFESLTRLRVGVELVV